MDIKFDQFEIRTLEAGIRSVYRNGQFIGAIEATSASDKVLSSFHDRITELCNKGKVTIYEVEVLIFMNGVDYETIYCKQFTTLANAMNFVVKEYEDYKDQFRFQAYPSGTCVYLFDEYKIFIESKEIE